MRNNFWNGNAMMTQCLAFSRCSWVNGIAGSGIKFIGETQPIWPVKYVHWDIYHESIQAGKRDPTNSLHLTSWLLLGSFSFGLLKSLLEAGCYYYPKLSEQTSPAEGDLPLRPHCRKSETLSFK